MDASSLLDWPLTTWLWPRVLLMARVSGLLLSAPIFSTGFVPRVVKVGLILVLTMFFSFAGPMPSVPLGAHWLTLSVAMLGEIACGVAIGLAAQLVYLAVQQAGIILSQQMGMTDAEVIDPTANQENESMATFMEMTFALLFLATGGHLLLLGALGKSFVMFPGGAAPSIPVMAAAVTSAGSSMMVFALKLAAPSLGAFLVLSVVLGVLARTLPDLNILFESFPLRVGLGLIMAAAMIPALDRFNSELSSYMQRLFS
jgi:flagellar biosynthetic protein FliR